MRLLDWFSGVLGTPPGNYEALIAVVWFYVTGLTLNLAAVIMLGTNIWHRRMTRRMSRASFLAIASFAMVMNRQLWLRHTGEENLGAVVSAVFWIFVGLSVLYFLYALILEWVIPFLLWGVGRLNRHEVWRDDDAELI